MIDSLLTKPAPLDTRQSSETQKAAIECIGSREGLAGIHELLHHLRSQSNAKDETLHLTTQIALKNILNTAGNFKGLPPDSTIAVEIALAVPTAEASQWLWHVRDCLGRL